VSGGAFSFIGCDSLIRCTLHTYYGQAETPVRRFWLDLAGVLRAALRFPMARRRKFSGEDESTNALETHSVRYYLVDLQRLERLAKVSGILPGVWLRQCLRALVDAFERKGSVSVPFVIVGRAEAEQAGLVPPHPPDDPASDMPTKIKG
jgi:hypothetical protein